MGNLRRKPGKPGGPWWGLSVEAKNSPPDGNIEKVRLTSAGSVRLLQQIGEQRFGLLNLRNRIHHHVWVARIVLDLILMIALGRIEFWERYNFGANLL